MAEQRLSVSIRMTRALLDALKEAADARSHSMNAEIVQRLEASLPKTTLLTEDFEKAMASAEPRDREERAMLLVYRNLSPKEREALRAMFDAFTDKDAQGKIGKN